MATIQNYATVCSQYLVFCLQVTLNQYPNLPHCFITPLATTLLSQLHSLKQASEPIPSQLITEILMALIIQINPYSRSDTSFHVLQFVALCMIKPDGSFDSHSLVTRLLSPLQYCLRLSFLDLYLIFSTNSTSSPQTNLSLILDEGLDLNLENMWMYITEGKVNSPFSWMHLMSFMT
jgi:hypothetical protein